MSSADNLSKQFGHRSEIVSSDLNPNYLTLMVCMIIFFENIVFEKKICRQQKKVRKITHHANI